MGFYVLRRSSLSLATGLTPSDFTPRDLSQKMPNSLYRRVCLHITYKLALLFPFLPAIDSGGMDVKTPREDFTCHPEATQPDC